MMSLWMGESVRFDTYDLPMKKESDIMRLEIGIVSPGFWVLCPRVSGVAYVWNTYEKSE